MESKSKVEKVTTNLSIMELAQIDLLVDSMIYTNRSDFIRKAINQLLEKHKDDLEGLYNQSQKINFNAESSLYGGIGIYRLSKDMLLDLVQKKKKVEIMVMGILLIDNDITTDLFENIVIAIKIYGKIQASKEIIELIENRGIKI